MATILLVDGQPVLANVIAKTLTRKGLKVVEVGTAELAVETARSYSSPIALVILNNTVTLGPDRSLMDEILLVQPGARFLRISDEPESVFRSSGELRPEAFFLRKPFLPAELVDRVSTIIGW